MKEFKDKMFLPRKIATLVGCAIGDALGNPFEMKAAISPALTSWDGQFKDGGTFWKGKAGQYTDDTLMSIALAKSLIKNNGFDGADVATNYLAWMNSGETRGIGGTTAEALTMLKFGASWTESGLKGPKIGGNGTAMRASPIGLAYRNNQLELLEVAMQDASITHNSLEPHMGSIAVALGVAQLANDGDCYVDRAQIIRDVLTVIIDSVVKTKLELALSHLEKKTNPVEALANIGSAGYVPETVAAAFYCFAATETFKDCVVMAVKAGGDTDTTAAVAGALAGTHYGLDLIPQEYKDGVENFELLNKLTQELLAVKLIK